MRDRLYPIASTEFTKTVISLLQSTDDWSLLKTEPRRIVHNSGICWIEFHYNSNDQNISLVSKEYFEGAYALVGDMGSNAAYEINLQYYMKNIMNYFLIILQKEYKSFYEKLMMYGKLSDEN